MLITYALIITQIITESFPISSSGHLQLIMCILHRFGFCASISCALHDLAQACTLVVMSAVFWREWTAILTHMIRWWRHYAKLIGLGFVACVPTLAAYIVLHEGVTHAWPLSLGFATTLGALYSLHYLPHQTYRAWSVPSAFLIGCAQGVALLPGISRFGITFVVGRWLGLSPRHAFNVSWLLQVPLLIFALVGGVVTIGPGDWLVLMHPITLLVLLLSTWCAYNALVWMRCLASRDALTICCKYLGVPLIISLLMHV